MRNPNRWERFFGRVYLLNTRSMEIHSPEHRPRCHVRKMAHGRYITLKRARSLVSKGLAGWCENCLGHGKIF